MAELMSASPWTLSSMVLIRAVLKLVTASSTSCCLLLLIRGWEGAGGWDTVDEYGFARGKPFAKLCAGCCDVGGA